MLALSGPSRLPRCVGATLVALPLLKHPSQCSADSPKTWARPVPAVHSQVLSPTPVPGDGRGGGSPHAASSA